MRIIIIGCGRMGSGLARTLCGRGHAVTVVDREQAAFDLLGRRFKGHTVVGVGFDRDVLLRAGIERADGLAAVTASDETHNRTPRRHTVVGDPIPVTYASSAATANATNGMTAAFSKNNRPPRKTSRPVTA